MWPFINAHTSWHKPGTLTFLTLPQEEPALGKGKIKPRGENSGKKELFVIFSHHINNPEMSIGEDNGIGRSCHGQHEGQRRSQCAGQHHIERVEANCFSLGTKREQRWWFGYPEMHRNLFGRNLIVFHPCQKPGSSPNAAATHILVLLWTLPASLCSKCKNWFCGQGFVLLLYKWINNTYIQL